jgi:hypothetical protein
MATLIRSMLLFVGILLAACEDPALVITVTRENEKVGVDLRVCHAAPHCGACAENVQNVFSANEEQSTKTRDVAIYFSDPPSPFIIQLDVDANPIEPADDHLPLNLEGLEWPVNLRLVFYESKPPDHSCDPEKACSPWTECQD